MFAAEALLRDGAGRARARRAGPPEAQHDPLQLLQLLHAVPVRTRHTVAPPLPILTVRNAVLSAETPPSARETLRMYAKAVPEELRRAEHCTGCGRCNPHCPQSIDIPKELAAIDAWIDTLKNEEAGR